MKTAPVIALFFILMANICYGQYYFNDIIITQQTNKQYIILKNNRVQQVSAKSFEADGEPTENFVLEQTVSGNGNTITTTANYPSAGTSETVSLYANNRIMQTTANTENIKSTTNYLYDERNIIAINSNTEDGFMNNASQEKHLWQYQNNQPVQMLLIKNNTDTTIVDFVQDEQGNIAEEHWKKKGRTTEKYFYYYNSQNQLTDIVRYNAKAQRLLPEYLFEYDTTGTVTQLTQVPQGSAEYLIWQYRYADNNLKQKELCFNKQKQLVGRIDYSYR